MKKIVVSLLMALFLLAVFSITALATEIIEVAADVAQGVGAIEEIQESGLPMEPFTWSALATIAGATAATLLIVQLLKLPLDKLWKIPTRIWVYIIAFAIMLCATWFTTGMDLSTALLTAVNAVIVALSAMGAYEISFAKSDSKRKEEPPDAAKRI